MISVCYWYVPLTFPQRTPKSALCSRRDRHNDQHDYHSSLYHEFHDTFQSFLSSFPAAVDSLIVGQYDQYRVVPLCATFVHL